MCLSGLASVSRWFANLLGVASVAIIYLALSPSCVFPSPLSYISMMEAIAQHEVCDPLGVSWEQAGMGSRDRTHLLESQAPLFTTGSLAPLTSSP